MATLSFHAKGVDLAAMTFEGDLEGRVYLYGILTTDGASVTVATHAGDPELGILEGLPDGPGYATTFVLDTFAVVYEYASDPVVWPVRIIPYRVTGEDATSLDVVLTLGNTIQPTPTVTEAVVGGGDYIVTGLPTAVSGNYSLTFEAGLFATTITWTIAETQLLVSVATMLKWIGEDVDEALLICMEQGVVAFLEKLTGRLLPVPEQPITEIVDGAKRRGGRLTPSQADFDAQCFLIKEVPTSPILSISYRYCLSDDWEDQDLADFEQDGRTVYVKDGYLPVGQRLVQVVYPFGYATDGGPPDVTLLVFQMVKHLYDQRDIGAFEDIEAKGAFEVTVADFGDQAQAFVDKAMAILGRGENFA